MTLNDRSVVDKEEAELLILYAAKTRGDIMELGTRHGGTTAIFREVCPEEYSVWTIDNFSSYWASPPMKVIQYWKRIGCNANLILGDTASVGRIWPGKIGMLFIDASHDYDSVIADFEAWQDKIIDDGIIAMHDVCDHIPGTWTLAKTPHGAKRSVVEAYNYLMTKHPEWKFIDRETSTVILKRGDSK